MGSNDNLGNIAIIKIKGVGTALKGIDNLFTQAKKKNLKDEELLDFLIKGIKMLNTISDKDEKLLKSALPEKYEKFLNGKPYNEEDKKPHVDIKLLGSGLGAYMDLEREAMAAVIELDVSGPFQQIRDPEEIEKYGIHPIPALVINEKVVSSGHVMKKDEIKKLILEAISKSSNKDN